MCIICNCDHRGTRFLEEFSSVRVHMNNAAEAMLECSKVARDSGAQRQYDAAHKLIVRLSREWNKIEHMREHVSADSASGDQ